MYAYLYVRVNKRVSVKGLSFLRYAHIHTWQTTCYTCMYGNNKFFICFVIQVFMNFFGTITCKHINAAACNYESLVAIMALVFMCLCVCVCVLMLLACWFCGC